MVSESQLSFETCRSFPVVTEITGPVVSRNSDFLGTEDVHELKLKILQRQELLQTLLYSVAHRLFLSSFR